MKVSTLIVEDDQEKLRNLLAVLKHTVGDLLDEPVIARDGVEARRRLTEKQFDLLILDIALPLNSESRPANDGGSELLKEMLARDIYFRPKDVVGLTAFPELRDSAAQVFAEELWSVVQYDPTREDWADQIIRKVRHLNKVNTTPNVRGHDCDLCILTAMYDPEFRAVLALPWNWREFQIADDTTTYYEGEYSTAGGMKRVLAGSASRVGMPSAAASATKMLAFFRPRYLAMTGICAGIHGRCNLGDVIVADPAWDWGSGKYAEKDGNAIFLPSPHQLGLHSSLKTKFERLARKDDVLANIRAAWQGITPDTALKMHVSPSASGAAVLADGRRIEEIEQHNRKVMGIEMETYGVYAAAWEGPLPQAMAFSLKGVSDFADKAKDDSFQHYGAYVSAALLKVFAETLL